MPPGELGVDAGIWAAQAWVGGDHGRDRRNDDERVCDCDDGHADGHGDDDGHDEGRDGLDDDDQECVCAVGYADVRQECDSGCDHEDAGDDDNWSAKVKRSKLCHF